LLRIAACGLSRRPAKAGAYLNYRDPDKGVVSLDPMISFAADPQVAVDFAVKGNRVLFYGSCAGAPGRPG
jgi:hypothetical protein